MVSGRGEAVTPTPRVSQCADTHNTARGRGNVSPRRCHSRRQELSSIAFIGEPWPRNRTGIRMFVFIDATSVRRMEKSSKKKRALQPVFQHGSRLAPGSRQERQAL